MAVEYRWYKQPADTAFLDYSHTAYLAASATSVGLAVGLSRLVPRLPVSPTSKLVLSKLVPFISVASAGIVNISCIRWKEMDRGVDVYRVTKTNDHHDGDETTIDLGKSKVAGRMAVGQSAASRVLTMVPILLVPQVGMALLERQGAFVGPRGKTWSTIAQLTLSE